MSELLDRDTGFSSADELKALESLTQAPHDKADYEATAADILATISKQREKYGLAEAYNMAREAYTDPDQEENPYMRHFGEVLLRAPYIRRLELHAHELAARRQADPSSFGQDDYHELRQMAYGICEYNHQLRDVIVESEGAIERRDLETWLTKTALAGPRWAEHLIGGVAAELATLDSLRRVPEISFVRFGTVEEDLKGQDLIVATRGGTQFGVDVKTGGQRYSTRITPRGKDIELPIDRADLDGFRLTAAAEYRLGSQMKDLLHKAAA